jgi:hypothetical protein
LLHSADHIPDHIELTALVACESGPIRLSFFFVPFFFSFSFSFFVPVLAPFLLCFFHSFMH